MSRDMYLARDLLDYSPPVFNGHMLTTPTALADRVLYNAQVVTHHRAPDLYQMIFGTDERPEMNGAAG